MSLASSAAPEFFPDSLPASCGALAPFRLCSRSQPQSAPWDLTSEARASAPSPHPSRRVTIKPLGLVSAGRHRSSVWESLRFALCTPVAVLSSIAPKLPSSATCSLRPERVFLVCGNLSSSQLPPTVAGPIPILLSLLFLFSFALPRYVGSFLLFGRSEVFCQHSVGVL